MKNNLDDAVFGREGLSAFSFHFYSVYFCIEDIVVKKQRVQGKVEIAIAVK